MKIVELLQGKKTAGALAKAIAEAETALTGAREERVAMDARRE
jgi:hypothetical protein